MRQLRLIAFLHSGKYPRIFTKAKYKHRISLNSHRVLSESDVDKSLMLWCLHGYKSLISTINISSYKTQACVNINILTKSSQCLFLFLILSCPATSITATVWYAVHYLTVCQPAAPTAVSWKTWQRSLCLDVYVLLYIAVAEHRVHFLSNVTILKNKLVKYCR